MARKILIVLLLTAAAGATWTVAWKASHDQRVAPLPSEAGNHDRVAELEEEMGRLKQAMYRVSSRTNQILPESVPAPAGMPAKTRDEPSATVEDPDLYRERNAQAVATKFSQLSEVLANQTRDPVWATSAEKELGTIVRQLQESGMKGVTVLGGECKSSMCKLDTAYDNEEAQMQVSARMRSPFFAGGELRRYEENGQFRSTAYFYRQGYDRPL